jgi:hypothetical protein
MPKGEEGSKEAQEMEGEEVEATMVEAQGSIGSLGMDLNNK